MLIDELTLLPHTNQAYKSNHRSQNPIGRAYLCFVPKVYTNRCVRNTTRLYPRGNCRQWGVTKLNKELNSNLPIYIINFRLRLVGSRLTNKFCLHHCMWTLICQCITSGILLRNKSWPKFQRRLISVCAITTVRAKKALPAKICWRLTICMQLRISECVASLWGAANPDSCPSIRPFWRCSGERLPTSGKPLLCYWSRLEGLEVF